MNQRLDAAMRYLKKRRWSVIPLEGKRPRISWKPFQERLPSSEEVRQWWAWWPAANIGIVCGKVSDGLAVLDIDDVELAERLLKSGLPKEAMMCRTPRGGLHIYLTESKSSSSSGPLVAGVADMKAEGGYVVAPPSPDYRWVAS